MESVDALNKSMDMMRVSDLKDGERQDTHTVWHDSLRSASLDNYEPSNVADTLNVLAKMGQFVPDPNLKIVKSIMALAKASALSHTTLKSLQERVNGLPGLGQLQS